ncbi:cytochrome C oxidase subunit IV family protein [Paracoccus yeei]|uniref:cytochrome C oxidase subunit IV family protein n=1 Tax=Paracoccus yeei TaxID=147645 RepID=UPI001749E25C|nr:cytochrome C oxidase subunit IV family protein [Paracoccus yeei]
MKPLTRTWALLIGLSAGTILLAPVPGGAAMAGLLILAWLKARTILGGFLHLRAVPGWLSMITVPLALWLAAVWGLSALAFR